MKHLLKGTALFILSSSIFFTANSLAFNTLKIDKLTGSKGHLNTQKDVYRISIPRDDLKINANGVELSSDMGLTSNIAFKQVGEKTLLIGELVLTPDQISSVMNVALTNNIQVLSLHNAFLWDSPQVVTMQIQSTGDEAKLAQVTGKLFDKIKQTSDGKGELPYANLNPAMSTLSATKLNKILGIQGTLKNGVYKAFIDKSAKNDDYEIGGDMGLKTWASFVGSNDESVVNGNMVAQEEELQDVLKALHHAGIFIVGVHPHLTDLEPRFVTVNFWGVGNTTSLAKGIRSAMDVKPKPEE